MQVQLTKVPRHEYFLSGPQKLTTVLNGFLKKGNKLQLETKVDNSLIGGMVVVLGDRYIDLSISSKLKTYENIVKETL